MQPSAQASDTAHPTPLDAEFEARDEGPGVVLAAPFDGSVAEARPSKWADYATLTKLRLNFMVLISAAVGYHMAVESIHWLSLLHVMIGTGLTAASSAVLNQWMEIERDRKMPRTRNRPLPAGRVSEREAFALGAILGVVGLGWLLATTNFLTFTLGLFTLATYLAIYTPLKVRSTLNTIVGAIPGAIPPLMGFTAATGAISTEALILFAIMFLWQMPHFLAIATLYREDYRAGGYVMLPVIDPKLTATSRQALIYLAALLLVSLAPSLFDMTGQVYTTVAMVLGTVFMMSGAQLATTRSRKDARLLFFVSIAYLPLLLGVMVFDKL